MGIMSKLAGSAIALSLLAGAAQATDLKLADFQPPTHFIVEKVYNPFIEAVSAATGGDVTVTAYMGGELGAGPGEQYNRVVDGVADIAFSLPGYTASTFPLTLMTELPGSITAETGTDRILANLDMLKDEYKRVVLVSLWNNSPNLLLMANKEVHGIDDLAGLNIRVPSRNAGIVVQAWGANPVSMPAPEIYNALQTGVLDGAMIDASTLYSFKLAEVTSSVTMGMDTTISDFFLVMNRDVFSDLDDTAQAAILDAGKAAAVAGHDAYATASAGALEKFAATEGKTIIELDADAAAAFNAKSAEAVEQILAEADAEGLPARAFVEALQAE